jgi:Putative F0F1-ATPase subunit Ca2+/Mg2+ transporter
VPLFFQRFVASFEASRRCDSEINCNFVPPPPAQHPLALAMEWVAKITTVGLVMVLPAVGGEYLDTRLGTKYWVLIGLGCGVVAGMVHLLRITRSPPKPPTSEDLLGKDRQDPSGERSGKQ